MSKLVLPDLGKVREARQKVIETEKAFVTDILNNLLSELISVDKAEKFVNLQVYGNKDSAHYAEWLPELRNEITAPWRAVIHGQKKNLLLVFPVDENPGPELIKIFRQIDADMEQGGKWVRAQETARQQYLKQEATSKKRKSEAVAAAAGGGDQEVNVCQICFDQSANTRALPCKHTVVCKTCSDKLNDTPDAKICVACRGIIESIELVD